MMGSRLEAAYDPKITAEGSAKSGGGGVEN